MESLSFTAILLFFCVTHVYGTSNYFTHLSQMDNKIYSSGLLDEVEATLRLDCVSHCLSNENCNVALFNQVSTLCRLYDNNATGLMNQTGWQAWGVGIAVATAATCGTPDPVANAAVSFTTMTYSSTASYSCDIGYSFTGSSPDAVCDETGQWAGFSGSCDTVSCGVPGNIANGDVTYTTMTYGSMATYTCHTGYHFFGYGEDSVVSCQNNGNWSFPGICVNIGSCADILADDSMALNGIYLINPRVGTGNVNVYCDMTNDGGGWTVIQRRTDGSENFDRDWADYKAGFGTLTNEFWLGNVIMNRITDQQNYEARIDLADFLGNTRYALYSEFLVRDEDHDFRLRVDGYSGNAGDSLANYHDNLEFTTRDRDNDDKDGGNCALTTRGGWWYGDCLEANLNGEYSNNAFANGINWKAFKGLNYSLKSSTMKVRPK